MYFFFFKQKTAYEMRISDWSSDVCSSDLSKLNSKGQSSPSMPCIMHLLCCDIIEKQRRGSTRFHLHRSGLPVTRLLCLNQPSRPMAVRPAVSYPASGARSEEHTSELQSLMRISYAVFCLKKQNQKINIQLIQYTIQHTNSIQIT